MERSACWVVTVLLASGCMLLSGFRKAEMELPAALAARDEPAVSVKGSNPRIWNRPLAFGAYRTLAVHEGAEFSWSLPAFGARGGTARQRYQLTLDGPDGIWEVECRNRSIEAWRGGFTAVFTDAFTPRLQCAFRDPQGQIARFALASDGRKFRGQVEPLGGERVLLVVSSVHRLKGTRLPLSQPAGYAFESSTGELIGAVETINQGRVWLTPESAGAPVPATIAAILLFNPDLSPQLD